MGSRVELFQNPMAQAPKAFPADISVSHGAIEIVDHLAPDPVLVTCDVDGSKTYLYFFKTNNLIVRLFESDEDNEGLEVSVREGDVKISLSGEQCLLIESRLYPRKIEVSHEEEDTDNFEKAPEIGHLVKV